MKQFLLDKFNSLTKDTLIAFTNAVTKSMPVFKSGFTGLPIWGYTDTGFWTVHPINTCPELRFYGNDGSVHLLGMRHDQTYFDLYQRIYNDFQNTGYRCLTPVSIEEVSIVPHTDLYFNLDNQSQVRTLYYTQFTSPTGGIITPALFFGEGFENTTTLPVLTELVDQSCKLLSTFKEVSIPFPRLSLSYEYMGIDNQGLFHTIFPTPAATAEQGLAVQQEAMDVVTNYALTNMSSDEQQTLQTLMSEKWQPLTI